MSFMTVVWEWALRIVTGATLAGGLVAIAALVSYGWLGLLSLVGRNFKVYGVLWEFVYFKFSRKKDGFLLRENAELRAEVERLRKLTTVERGQQLERALVRIHSFAYEQRVVDIAAKALGREP